MLTAILLTLGLFALQAATQSSVLVFTRAPNPMTVGEPQTILYSSNDSSNPVQITLLRGPTTEFETVEVLTTDATAGQYIWTPSRSIADGNDYALKISQGAQVNYFGPFTIQGGSSSASTSSAASVSSSSQSTQPFAVSVSGQQSSTATSTSTTVDNSIPASPTTTREGNISSQTSTPQPSPDSLGTGAAAGIGVGATLGAIAIVGLVLWLLWRRRKNAKSSRADDARQTEEYAATPSMPEKYGIERYEAPDTSRIQEAGGTSRAELEGGWQGAEFAAKR